MMELSGEVKNMTVPHLFLGLRAGKKTGIAVFEQTGAVKKVYFKDGYVLFASSNLDDDRLGECLLRVGAITQEQYDVSVVLLKKTDKKQGAILLELGILSSKDLVASVQLQVASIILSLFSWRDGSYRFDEGPPPLDDIIPLQMSSGNLILEGVRRLDWQTVRDSLPPLETVLRPATDPVALFQNADLSQNQKAVLSLIDGKRSIKEICALSKAGDFYTLKVIYILLSLRMAEVGMIESEEERDFAREAVKQAVAVEERKPERSGPAASPMKQKILKALEKLDGQDHREVLGLNEDFSPQEAQAAYLRLAKLYHPDRHFDGDMQDMKSALEKLFSRITEAYNALNNRAQREHFAYLSNLGRAKSARKTESKEDRSASDDAEKTPFAVGVEKYEAGNYLVALESFRKASKLDPRDSGCLYYQGLVLSQLPRKLYEAEECFKKALKLDPSKTDYAIELGKLYVKRGLKSNALSVLREALARDPESERIKEALMSVESEKAG
jgi:tetratricopeptide (TPR) repeat protein